MKKWFIFLLIILFLSACAPSDEQIQAALEKTQTAQPTETPTITQSPLPTNTPEPTATPTNTPSPTPSFSYFNDLSHEFMEEKFESIGMDCSDQVIELDKSYEQECFGVYSDCFVMGKMSGHSTDTMDQFLISLMARDSENIDEKIKDTFLNFVSFGNNVEEKQDWVIESLEVCLDADEEEEVRKFFDDAIMLIHCTTEYSILSVGARK